MDTHASPTLIADASVLINFLCIDRIDLLAASASEVLITDHVVAEITAAYPDELERLSRALRDQQLRVITVTDPKDLAAIAGLRRSTEARLGVGECSAIVVAAGRGFDIAIDDGAAIKHIRHAFPNLSIRTTKDIMVALVRKRCLSADEADTIKTTWHERHRFTLKIASFRDFV